MVEIQKLNKSYLKRGKHGRTTPILADINLKIEKGEFFCILGKSGCGKTTLLNILGGFITDYEGTVLYNGQQISTIATERLMLFQESALFPWLTVSENVGFGLKMAGLSKEEQKPKTEDYLELVGLSGMGDYLVHELSGGMKQRVALARALVLNSNLLLMDEPFAALDQNTKNELRAELLSIWKMELKTIIFVTHDIEEAILLGDRIAIMKSDPGAIKQLIEIKKPREERQDITFLHTLKNQIKEIMANEDY